MKVRFLITADLHLRDDKPVCRKDADWFESQRTDLAAIGDIAEKYAVDQIYVLGDIFHTPTVPAKIVNLAIDAFHNWEKKISSDVFIMAGNHDLPYHNNELRNNCSYGIINRMFNHIACDGWVAAYNFGTEEPNDAEVVAIHRLVMPSNQAELAKMSGAQTTADISKEFPNSSVILMGDYHEGFIEYLNNQMFIMPGCMNIQSAGLADYKPFVVILEYESDTKSFSAQKVYLPENPNAVISTDHIVEAKERDERLEHCMEVAAESLKKEFDFAGELKAISRELKIEDLTTEMMTELNIN